MLKYWFNFSSFLVFYDYGYGYGYVLEFLGFRVFKLGGFAATWYLTIICI